MPLLNLSVKHGQSWEAARNNFESGIAAAQQQFGMWIQRVEWSSDRTSAQLHGPGFTVAMSIDEQEVHAVGDLPFFARFLEAPIKKYLQETFRKSLPS